MRVNKAPVGHIHIPLPTNISRRELNGGKMSISTDFMTAVHTGICRQSCPADTWCNYNVTITSIRRGFDVIMTLLLRHVFVGLTKQLHLKVPSSL